MRRRNIKIILGKRSYETQVVDFDTGEPIGMVEGVEIEPMLAGQRGFVKAKITFNCIGVDLNELPFNKILKTKEEKGYNPPPEETSKPIPAPPLFPPLRIIKEGVGIIKSRKKRKSK